MKPAIGRKMRARGEGPASRMSNSAVTIASGRESIYMIKSSGLQDDFHAVVLFLVKDVVTMRPFRERQTVRDDVVELDLALLDPPDQLVDVALRRALAETHLDAFVENLAERKVIVGHTIDARYGDPTAASHRANRGAQRF